MSKLTRRTMVLVALCAGALAALLVVLFLNREKAAAAQKTEPVQVVVATRDLPARTVIEPGMVREKTLPAGILPANPASSVREVMGQVTLAALKEEQPLERSALAAPDASLGLAYVVPEGMRAVTVALDPIIGVAGFLKAGDHVDVLATFEVDKVSVTKTVLQDVELLAIGPEILPEELNRPREGRDARPKEQPNATLALRPEDAEKLILAESKGKLRLTLRPKGDAEKVALAGMRSDSLIGVRPASTTGAARASARVMSVGYTSPGFLGNSLGSSLYGARLPEAGPQPIRLGGEGETSAALPSTRVETVRGTQTASVEVRVE